MAGPSKAWIDPCVPIDETSRNRSFLKSHFFKQEIRDYLPKPLVLELKLLQHVTHLSIAGGLVTPYRLLRDPEKYLLQAWQGQFPPPVKRHDAHAQRLAHIHLGFACAGKLVCPSKFRKNFLSECFFIFPPKYTRVIVHRRQLPRADTRTNVNTHRQKQRYSRNIW